MIFPLDSCFRTLHTTIRTHQLLALIGTYSMWQVKKQLLYCIVLHVLLLLYRLLTLPNYCYGTIEFLYRSFKIIKMDYWKTVTSIPMESQSSMDFLIPFRCTVNMKVCRFNFAVMLFKMHELQNDLHIISVIKKPTSTFLFKLVIQLKVLNIKIIN